MARILVVDDNAVMLDAISQMLRHDGHEVFPAAGPRQALEIIKNIPAVHLVLSDVVMPEMQGAQLIREVVRLSPQTVGMLMTGFVRNAEDVPDGVALLKKPFTRQELVCAVETALSPLV